MIDGTPIRRMDHVAIVVADTATALDYFVGQLGLTVSSTEEGRGVRLTYLDAGNAYIQLLEPFDPNIEIARWLAENGEGLHHICFGVDDVPTAAAALGGSDAAPIRFGTGRGRVSAWVPGNNPLGLRVECTEFRPDEDIEPGCLPESPRGVHG